MNSLSISIESACRNRNRLLALLPNNVIVLKGNSRIVRSMDVHYPFRQDAHFLYLTGVEEPDCFLILTQNTEILFIPKVTQHHLVWMGHADTPASAQKKYRFQRVCNTEQLASEFKKITRSASICLAQESLHAQLKKMNPRLHFHHKELKDALHTLRSAKTTQELQLMRHVSDISSAAHKLAMLKTRPGMFEYQVQSFLEKELLFDGIKNTAYPSIVASGVNSAILHYHANDHQMRNGELLLIDAGGEHHGYAADITRTFPVNGRFSEKQKDIYEIVLEAQQQCIAKIRPDMHLDELQKTAIDILMQGLLDLKILKGSSDAIREKKTYTLFYPHGVSHMLGLDVHDVYLSEKTKNPDGSNLRARVQLKTNYVITVEPGLYFIRALLEDREKQKEHREFVNWSKAFSYLDFGGVRIEDDVVVTETGSLNLTKIPKTVRDIETLMSHE